MKRTLRKFGTLGIVCGLLVGAGEASAVIVGAVNNGVPIVDSVAPYPATQVLSTTFGTSVPNQLVRIVYNAECSIGGGTSNWLDTNIIVDPAGPIFPPFIVPPSNSDNALCAGNGTDNYSDGWVSAVTQVYARIPSVGIHSVRVVVTPFPGVAWRVDDQSLVVDTQ